MYAVVCRFLCNLPVAVPHRRRVERRRHGKRDRVDRPVPVNHIPAEEQRDPLRSLLHGKPLEMIVKVHINLPLRRVSRRDADRHQDGPDLPAPDTFLQLRPVRVCCGLRLRQLTELFAQGHPRKQRVREFRPPHSPSRYRMTFTANAAVSISKPSPKCFRFSSML